MDIDPVVTLADSWEKLRWANERFESIRPHIEKFERAQDYRIRVEIDRDAGEYTFYVFDVKEADPEWSLIVGDCLNNARSALDYVAVRLWSFVTGEAPKDVAGIDFPIFDNVERFDQNATVARFRKNPVLRSYLARIEELQPFNVSNPAIWGLEIKPGGSIWPTYGLAPTALLRLNSLNNIDKHRVIHVLAQSGALTFPPNAWPADFTYLGGSGPYFGKLGKDTKMGQWRFRTPLPSDWEPSEMEMKRYFALEVSVDEPFPFKAVLKLIPYCLAGVQAVLTIFNPVFALGKPPLSVTATQPGSVI